MFSNKNSKQKSDALRKILDRKGIISMPGCFDALSAKLIEREGIEVGFMSGFSVSSTKLGMPDTGLISFSEMLEQVKNISNATSIPFIFDGDTGYGNFNNFRRVVSKLCQRKIAGVCIEDKQYPKTNSFQKKYQKLADIDEFCGKIQAGKDMQDDDNFSIVARVEALIAGWGIGEAIKRAEAYCKAGADAILIHSSKDNANEILKFKKEWGNKSPVIIIPTTYHKTPTNIFKKAGFSTVIWANHSLRASIKAIQDVTNHLIKKESVKGLEKKNIKLE